MSGFPILDLVVGMIFIFFLLSIVCSSAVELWFSIWRTRASLLEKWLRRIFDSPALRSDGTPAGISVGQAIMDHCTATALSDKGKSPTYINASNFVSALLDKITLRPSDNTENTVQLPAKNLQEYITAIQNSGVISGELKRTFLALAYEAEKAAGLPAQMKSELDHFRERLEQWYNKSAERLTDRFKSRRVLPATFITAILITVLFNADSLAIGKYLYENKELSKQLSDQAVATIGKYENRVYQIKNSGDTTGADDAAAIKRLDNNVAQLRQDISKLKDSVAVNLPLGWQDGKVDLSKTRQHLMGWLASILAICLGAPFWFDMLNKIANLRGNGRRPPTDKAEVK